MACVTILPTLATDDDEYNQKSRVVVRLKSSFWTGADGLNMKKSLSTLRRKSQGFNFLYEDATTIGEQRVIERIENLFSVPDGIYEVIPTNHLRDWETGYVEDYDYKLVPFEQ